MSDNKKTFHIAVNFIWLGLVKSELQITHAHRIIGCKFLMPYELGIMYANCVHEVQNFKSSCKELNHLSKQPLRIGWRRGASQDESRQELKGFDPAHHNHNETSGVICCRHYGMQVHGNPLKRLAIIDPKHCDKMTTLRFLRNHAVILSVAGTYRASTGWWSYFQSRRRCGGWRVQPLPGWSLSDWHRSDFA